MRKSTKMKAARILTSSLLSSDLTPKELMEICDSLMGKDEFVYDLAYSLQKLVGNTMYSNSDEYEDSAEIEYAISLMKSKRITKERYLEILSDMIPGLSDYLKEQRLTMKSMLELTLEHTDPGFFSELLRRLNNDEYLDHILDRNI